VGPYFCKSFSEEFQSGVYAPRFRELEKDIRPPLHFALPLPNGTKSCAKLLGAVFVLGGIYVGTEEMPEDALCAELIDEAHNGMAFGVLALSMLMAIFSRSQLSAYSGPWQRQWGLLVTAPDFPCRRNADRSASCEKTISFPRIA
jgi:hypothetical protein